MSTAATPPPPPPQSPPSSSSPAPPPPELPPSSEAPAAPTSPKPAAAAPPPPAAAQPAKPKLVLNLDEPGISRAELLAAFPDVLQLEPTILITISTGSGERRIPATRCLVCQKVFKSKSPGQIVTHLKSPGHQNKRRSAEEDLHPAMTHVLDQYPNAFVRFTHNSVQCVICRIELRGTSENVKGHLQTERHLRAKSLRAQRDAIDQMDRAQFDRLLVQTLCLDGGLTVGQTLRLGKALEPIIGRPTPSSRDAVQSLQEELAKAEEEDGKGQRVALPEDPMKPLRALKMVDKVLNKKKKGKGGGGGGKKRKTATTNKVDDEEEEEGEPRAKKAKKNSKVISKKKNSTMKMKKKENDESARSKGSSSSSTSDSNSAIESRTAVSGLARYNSGFQANNFSFLGK